MSAMNALGSVKNNYSVETIIHVLLKNKIVHITEYNNALKVYNASMAAKLTELVESIPPDTTSMKPISIFDNFGFRNIPQDKSKNYDDLISLFSSGLDTIIQLTFSEADTIFNDNWDWIIGAKTVNSFYNSMDSAGSAR